MLRANKIKRLHQSNSFVPVLYPVTGKITFFAHYKLQSKLHRNIVYAICSFPFYMLPAHFPFNFQNCFRCPQTRRRRTRKKRTPNTRNVRMRIMLFCGFVRFRRKSLHLTSSQRCDIATTKSHRHRGSYTHTHF